MNRDGYLVVITEQHFPVLLVTGDWTRLGTGPIRCISLRICDFHGDSLAKYKLSSQWQPCTTVRFVE